MEQLVKDSIETGVHKFSKNCVSESAQLLSSPAVGVVIVVLDLPVSLFIIFHNFCFCFEMFLLICCNINILPF